VIIITVKDRYLSHIRTGITILGFYVCELLVVEVVVEVLVQWIQLYQLVGGGIVTIGGDCDGAS